MKSAFPLLCCMSLALCVSSGAQQVTSPPPLGASQVADNTWRTLSGFITDSDGALVPGATITLSDAASTQKQSTTSDDQGHFSFSGVPPGAFTLTVAAGGLQGTTVQGTLNEDESLELPPIQLRVAADSTSVEVSSLTQKEVAAQQLKQEEKQRLAGVVPNFYVTYDWNAAPLDTPQKYKLAVRSLFDPATFVIVGGFAGIEQALNSYSGYGQGAMGYAKRYGAGMANAGIGTVLGGAVFPELFHQDPRYFYKGKGSIRSRVLYAISTAVIARGDNGKWQPAYAAVAADFSTAAISNLYYPASDRTGEGLTIENGFVNIGTNAAGNLLQEFLLKRLSTGIKALRAPQP
jgi:hypothetical protein